MRERSDQSRTVCELRCSFGEQSGQSWHYHEEAGGGNEELRGQVEHRQTTHADSNSNSNADTYSDGYTNSYSDGYADSHTYSNCDADGDTNTHADGDTNTNTYIIRSPCKRRERTSASLNSSMRISFSRDL